MKSIDDIFEVLMDFEIDEVKKPSKQKTTSALDNIIPKQFNQPLIPVDGSKSDKSDEPKESKRIEFKKATKDTTLKKSSNIRPNDQMRDMLSIMRDIESEPADPVYPEQNTDGSHLSIREDDREDEIYKLNMKDIS